jgi:hypothetical protein
MGFKEFDTKEGQKFYINASTHVRTKFDPFTPNLILVQGNKSLKLILDLR